MFLKILSRLVTFLVVCACVPPLHATAEGNEKLDIIYSDPDPSKANESLKCESIVGRVADCSECYTCDDSAVARHEAKGYEITRLELNDANCNSSEIICCVLQKDLKFREREDQNLTCGNYNPEGYPRALRPTLRTVLPGEYPWRAWIYHWQDYSVPLCAATYINKEGRTLMTAASCIDGYAAGSLRVLFGKPDKNVPLTVLRIDVHEGFDKATHVNDIAALSVRSVPEWAQRACLPVPIRAALHGTACLAVSEDDHFINQVIPKQTKCVGQDHKPIDKSLMCAVRHKDDYEPETGAGLYCADVQDANVFTVYGIHLYSTGTYAYNTNVAHFADWLIHKALLHRHL